MLEEQHGAALVAGTTPVAGLTVRTAAVGPLALCAASRASHDMRTVTPNVVAPLCLGRRTLRCQATIIFPAQAERTQGSRTVSFGTFWSGSALGPIALASSSTSSNSGAFAAARRAERRPTSGFTRLCPWAGQMGPFCWRVSPVRRVGCVSAVLAKACAADSQPCSSDRVLLPSLST